MRTPREAPRVPSSSFAARGRFDRTTRESRRDGPETARKESRNGSSPGRPERLWPRRENRLDQGSTAGFGRRCGTESATRGIEDGFGRRRGTGPDEETRAASAVREESPGGEITKGFGRKRFWQDVRNQSNDRDIIDSGSQRWRRQTMRLDPASEWIAECDLRGLRPARDSRSRRWRDSTKVWPETAGAEASGYV